MPPTRTDDALRPSALPAPDEAATGAGATGERLLQAAHELLHERAGGSVTVSEISSRAGANVAMVKYCFGSKDALLDALLERIMGSFRADLEDLSDRGLGPRETLERHVGGIARNFLRFPYLSALMNERFRSTDPDVARRLADAFVIPTERWHAALLRSGADEGAFRPIDPTFFFFSVIGASHFLFAARPWLEQAFDERLTDDFVERFVAHTTRLVLDGVGPRAAGDLSA